MNKIKNSLFRLLSIALFLGAINANAQEIKIQLGPDKVAENQAFTITATIFNSQLRSYNNFPDIPGFRKRGTSSSSNTNIVNGQISSSQSITMTYAPEKQGKFKLPPFSMKINDKTVSSPGKTIEVGPPIERRQRTRDPFDIFNKDPFEDFFGRKKNTEFVDIKEDAFLAFTTSKDEVYIGEGFTGTLSFYVSHNNRAPLQFHELGKQLSEVLKKLRPANCWEENFNIENINSETVVINNKRYDQFKIYQGAFFPLNTETIEFPSIGLEMIKYQVAKNPSFFGQNKKEGFKTFYSKGKKVRVKDLPDHPLKDQVAVGNYKLVENIDNQSLQTGQSFAYSFNVFGEGNISAIEKPSIKDNEYFDFYPPNISQNINRRNNRVTGSKSFKYFGIPNEPGTYNLGDYFNWIFFNPTTQKYDTLRSEKTLQVVGESKKNESIQANDLGAFYDIIDLEDNNLSSIFNFDWVKTFANVFILIMLAVSAIIIFKK